MKNFEMPTAEILALEATDIITTSPGQEWGSNSDIIYPEG